jgi:predicted nucleic acid-binding protein
MLFDSSAWIELLVSGPLAATCEKELAKGTSVIVPTVVIYEVYRTIARQLSEEDGLSVIAALNQRQVVELSQQIALEAADLSLHHRLPMADSLVLAHARHEDAVLVTLDNDFAEIEGVVILRSGGKTTTRRK